MQFAQLRMVNPASWAANLNSREAKLNVGQLAVIHLRRHAFGCMVTPAELGDVDLDNLPGYEPCKNMRWIEGTRWGFLSEKHVSSYRLLKRANLALIKEAASKQVRVRSDSRNSHAPGLLKYLRQQGHDVPDPSYAS
jgi:hypothetical protein